MYSVLIDSITPRTTIEYMEYTTTCKQPATKTTRDSNTRRFNSVGRYKYTHISKRKSSSVIILVFVHGVLLYFIPCNFAIRTNLLTQNTNKQETIFFYWPSRFYLKSIYIYINLYCYIHFLFKAESFPNIHNSSSSSRSVIVLQLISNFTLRTYK